MRSQTQCFTSYFLAYSTDLEHNTARFYNRNPSFWSTFTGTHTNFERFFRSCQMREDTDPNFTATLHVTCHGDTGSLDLTVAYVVSRFSNETKFTKVNRASRLAATFVAQTMRTTILCTFRH